MVDQMAHMSGTGKRRGTGLPSRTSNEEAQVLCGQPGSIGVDLS